MSHGVHLAAILDFFIRELQKLIISITFEPSDIETQTIPFFIKVRHEEPITKVTFAIETFIMPQIEQNMYLNALNQAKSDIHV